MVGFQASFLPLLGPYSADPLGKLTFEALSNTVNINGVIHHLWIHLKDDF